MLTIFYWIWVDCIATIRSKKKNQSDWKFKTVAGMTLPMSINLLVIMTILQRHILHGYFYDFEVSVFGPFLGGVIKFIVLFVLPNLALNYWLIFRKNRYEKLVIKYPDRGGKLYVSYFLASLFVPLIIAWIGVLFFT